MYEEMHLITLLAPAGSVLPGIRVLPSESEPEAITAAAGERTRTQQRIKDFALKVLIVDDEPTFRRALRYTLETDYGATVTEVPSGDAALRADIADYDVVLIDVKMPGMDGIVTCEKMLDRRVTAVLVLMSTDSSHLGSANSHHVSFYDKNHPMTALEPILLGEDGGCDA